MVNKIRGNIIGIIIACIFIFNPNISVIDILPDIIGYIILMLSITRLADLNETLSEARTSFMKMIFVDGGKLLSLLWIFGMSVTSERTASILLWSFIFCVLELLFAIPAFVKLFTGLTQLANLYPNENVFKIKNGKNKSELERLKTFTTLFLVFKSVLSFLPELADLTNSMYDEASSVTLSLYGYIGLLRALAFIPVFVLGIIWLYRIRKYFVSVSKDEAFVNALSERYETTILPKEGIFIKRTVQSAFIVLVLACILTLDLRLEGFNFLPDILSAIIFIVFFVILGRYAKIHSKYCMIISVVYLVLSVASYAAELYFFNNHSYNAIIRSDEALIAFIVMLVTEALKGISFVLAVLGAYKMLYNVVNDHTGYVLGREYITEATERQANAVKKELRLPLILMVIASAVYAASDVAYEALMDTFGFMGVVNMVCAAVFIFFVFKARAEISLAVNTKYMLE